MRAVVQRVSKAQVICGGTSTARIGKGLLVLLGVASDDTLADASYLADKVAELRIFEDDAGKMNLGIKEIAGQIVVVSQFTLLGDCRKGRRPSFSEAAAPKEAESLYLSFVERLRSHGISVATGTFQAAMEVELVNQGPVTLLLDSKRLF